MTNEAKIAALKGAAERKRQDALERTNQAIKKLVREGRKITFTSVAGAAGVSVAYLYKYDDLKERIGHLKTQQETNSKPAKPQPASDKSRQVIVVQLRERIKRLEAENRGLRDQNEAIYGRFCQLQSVQQQIDALRSQNDSLKAENNWLRQQLDQNRSSSENTILPISTSNSEVAQLEKQSVESQIQSALADIGIKLNPTLAKTIQSVPEATVLTAIDALKEAMSASNIERPGGWLKRAIEECWRPNENHQLVAKSQSNEVFNRWFNLARAKGLVTAGMRGEDGQQYVFDKEGVSYSFEQMLAAYPLETL